MRIIVCIILVGVVLGVAIMCLLWRHTRVKEDLFAARQEAARANAKLRGARRAVAQAEERCQALLEHAQDLDQGIARRVQVVSSQLAQLLGYIESSDGQPRHALPEQDTRAIAAQPRAAIAAPRTGVRNCTRTAMPHTKSIQSGERI
jgi:PAS domain-containing protein